MNRETLQSLIRAMRGQWRSVREERLGLKESLVNSGTGAAGIRKDPEYRRLKKDQRRLSTGLRHLEKKLARIKARDGEQER